MRRIVKANIRFISLVPRGANQMPVIFKADAGANDDNYEMSLLTKEGENFDERGELLACVYAPEIRDSQGDIADAEVIKDMLYNAARDGHSIDVRHNEKALPKEKVFVAESFIIQKGDERFKGFKNYSDKEVDVTGGWGIVLKVDDPELRKLYREKKWNGVSMGGRATLKVEKTDLDADSFVASLLKHLNPKPSTEDIDMDAKELKTLLKETIDEAIKPLDARLTKIEKPEPEPTGKEVARGGEASKAPAFKGEPTVENLRKHAKTVRRQSILDAIDWNDADSVTKGETDLSALEAEETDKGDVTAADKALGIAKEDNAEVRTLKRKLAKAQKVSNQGAASSKGKETVAKEDEPGEEELTSDAMSKEDLDLFKRGRNAAKAIQGRTALK